ncbi:MAG: 30S ribosomal protein S15 [Chitinivibrionales bacterium]|nr:30S ribosomal protein S15 [Chitinivibrionales bacterium]
MPLSKERKAELVKQYGKDEKDSGTTEVQVAILTDRINAITEHLKSHKQDTHTRYGLLKLVGQRRALLDYLKETHIERYRTVIKNVGIRK